MIAVVGWRSSGDAEFEQMVSIDSGAGYGSVFGDGNDVQVDLFSTASRMCLARGCA